MSSVQRIYLDNVGADEILTTLKELKDGRRSQDRKTLVLIAAARGLNPMDESTDPSSKLDFGPLQRVTQ